ncbi:Cyclic nucleotide-binding domain protein [Microbulbifer aggregans]|uniref:Cyclic nucleotide-binding domain protein n=1 Tax=Microbulbifer aggregans TaxID=1769779 RepID=A0A1C9WA25_9GAMM|nr:cyclic nucleotide-binding domain-containing protein [Microbulbifer aggregans]AOS97943.1 Cyclic nucleotide-binding domain protein [Microbulbifer aggregans]
MKTIAERLQEHGFFQGLPREQQNFIAGCGENSVFQSGDYLAREGEPADYFFLIRSGRVAVETFVPNHGALCLQTLEGGDIFGWSWLFPPYEWTFDARAQDTVHAIRLNGKCLREKCEAEPALGFELLKRFARITTARLKEARIQLLDLYGDRPPANPGAT